MSGDWPPEWDDPEEEFPAEADQQDATTRARLAEVSAYLASVPAPVLPDAVEARISAALAAEAVGRAGSPGTASSPGESRTIGPAPARARVGRRRGGGGRRGLRSWQLKAVGSVVACLVLAGVGYGLSRGSMSTSSGLASAAAESSPEQTAAAAAPAASASSTSSSAAAAASSTASSAPSTAAGTNILGIAGQFMVTASGTKYQAATLAAQVRASLASPPAATSGPNQVPGPSAPSPAPATTPSSALRGCVIHLTGGPSPRLVDRATYQGEPAYIIASSSRVWVVALGCTAANPELIASVPLAS